GPGAARRTRPGTAARPRARSAACEIPRRAGSRTAIREGWCSWRCRGTLEQRLGGVQTHGALERPHLAHREVAIASGADAAAQLDRPEAHADQPAHLAALRFPHAPHEPVAALPHDDVEPAVRGAPALLVFRRAV